MFVSELQIPFTEDRPSRNRMHLKVTVRSIEFKIHRIALQERINESCALLFLAPYLSSLLSTSYIANMFTD